MYGVELFKVAQVDRSIPERGQIARMEGIDTVQNQGYKRGVLGKSGICIERGVCSLGFYFPSISITVQEHRSN